jgi:hypothetical protein
LVGRRRRQHGVRGSGSGLDAVHLCSRIDVSEPDQNKAAAARFDAVYAAMFDGYRRYFTPA